MTYSGRAARRHRLSLERLEQRQLLAVDAALLLDINAQGGGSKPDQLTSVGSVFYFTASTPTTGVELYKSDGTAGGTGLVKDIFSGVLNSQISNLTAVGNTLFFTATDGVNGVELWSSQGTAATTQLVKDIRPGSDDASPQGLVNVNGVLFFAANDGTSGFELWKSDGTSGGTTKVKEIVAGSGGGLPTSLVNVNGTLFFQATDSSGAELWKSDGSDLGTVMVKDIRVGAGGSSPTNLYNHNGTLFFAATSGSDGVELWSSDGSGPGTSRVKDISAGSSSSSPGEFASVGSTLFFRATTSSSGTELWKTDGTSTGTTLVANIRAGNGSSTPTNLTNVGGTLFFRANDGVAGYELWKSDGSSGGTSLVKDIVAGATSSKLTNFAEAGGTLYFTADDGTTGYELWKSDGTSGGTAQVSDIRAGASGSTPASLLNFGGTLFFAANNGSAGYELWKSGGTAATTQIVRDIFTGGTYPSAPAGFVNVNGTIYFQANDGIHGLELWKTDGTAAGTQLVADINPGSANSYPSQFVDVNGTVFFQAATANEGAELWKTDGTTAGTSLVKDISPGIYSSYPANLINLAGKLYFSANDAVTGYELWTSNGTSTGTQRVVDIFTGDQSSSPSLFTNVGGTLYFTASNSSAGTELWKTDGTAPGTSLVRDIRAGVNSSYPSNLRNVNGTLYFTANNGSTGYELWKSSGTSAGTVPVKDIIAGPLGSSPQLRGNLGSILFFQADNGTTGEELWTSDGTSGGTNLVSDVNPGAAGFRPGNGVEFGGKLYFAGTTATGGREVWSSDGTAAGTSQLVDLNPSGDSNPDQFLVANGLLYFTANDGTHGVELFVSDGTSSGTTLVRDINAGVASSNPSGLTNFGGAVVFAADDGVDSAELWRVVITNSPPTGVSLANVTATLPENSNTSNPIPLADINIADDGVGVNTLSLSGADAAHFQIVGTSLRLKANETLDFETQAKYVVVISVDDVTVGTTPDASTTYTLTLTDVNDPPVINSNGGGDQASTTVVDGNTAVTTVTATNQEATPVQFRLPALNAVVAGTTITASNAPDQSRFSINATSGELVFNSPPSFMSPGDANGDNKYVLAVEVFDNDTPSASDLQFITVTVVESLGTTTLAEIDVTLGGVAKKQLVLRDDNNKSETIRVGRSSTNIVLTLESWALGQEFRVLGAISGAALSADKRTITIDEAAITSRGTRLILQTLGGDDTVILGNGTAGENDFIPGTSLLELQLGKGTNTVDIDDAASNATANTWRLQGDDSGVVTVGDYGSLAFSSANILNGGRGADDFQLLFTGDTSPSVSGGSQPNLFLTLNGDSGSQLDSVTVTRNANFALADNGLAIDINPAITGQADWLDMTFGLANIHRAFLTSGSANAQFTLDGWTSSGDGTPENSYGGRLVAGTGAIQRVVKNADLGTSLNKLSTAEIITGDGMRMNLSGVNVANVSDTGTQNTTLDVTGWNRSATLSGGSSGSDTIKFTNSGFYAMEVANGFLRMNSKYTLTTQGWEGLNVKGVALPQKVLIYSNTTFSANQITLDGGAGEDTVVYDEQASGDLNFKIEPNRLTADVAGGGKFSVPFSNFEKFVYDGGAGNNVVDATTWTGGGEFRGQNGSADKLLAQSASTSLYLKNQSLVLGTGATATTIVLKGVEDIELTGGNPLDGSNNPQTQRFVLDNWRGRATLNGGAGPDTLVVYQDADFVLDDNRVTVNNVDVNYSAMETLVILGGNSANLIGLRQGFDAGIPTSGDITIKSGAGADVLLLGYVATSGSTILESGLTGDISLVQQTTASVASPTTLTIGSGATARVLKFASNGYLPETVSVVGTSSSNSYSFTNFTGNLLVDGIDGADSDRAQFTYDASTYDLVLADVYSSLKVLGRTFSLTNVENATLAGNAAAQQFNVSGKSTSLKTLSVDGQGGTDVLRFFTSEAFTTVVADKITAGNISISATNVEKLEVWGDAGDNKVDLSGWTGLNATFNGGDGLDEIVLSKPGNMALTDTVLIHSANQSIVLASVEQATLTATGTGNDIIDASTFSGATTLYGGAGNDVLLGARGSDFLFGGPGDDSLSGGSGGDWLAGGDGNDSLDGGSGRDILIGGNQVDSLKGGADEDILIGGRTTYDGNLNAMRALLAYWSNSTDAYGTVDTTTVGLPLPVDTNDSRINKLFRTGVSNVGNTNKFYLRVNHPQWNQPSTVLDDGATDTFTGGADSLDWFFANLSGTSGVETIADAASGELITEL